MHVEAEKKKLTSGGHVKTIGMVDLANALRPYDDDEDDSSDDEAFLKPVKAVWRTSCPDSCCSPFGCGRDLSVLDDEDFPPLCGACDPDDVPQHSSITTVSNSFGALTDDAVHSNADVETEIAGWAHSVNKQSVNKNRKRGWMTKTKEDVDKISEIMGVASPRIQKEPLRDSMRKP